MNRKCATATAVASLVLCTQAFAVVIPGIAGSIRDDTGAFISGAVVRLYADDGDGMFDPSTDSQSGSDLITGADGQYSFRNIQEGKYFVTTSDQVSGLLDPTQPLFFIDDFEHARTVYADPMGPIATSSLAAPAAEVIGGERDLYVELISGIGDIGLKVDPYGTKVLEYDSSSGVDGRAVVTWDGIDNSGSLKPSMGLHGFDLTNNGGNEGFIFKLGVDAAGVGESMTLRIFSETSERYSDLEIPFPVSGGLATTMAIVPFSEFHGEASAESVDAIQLILGKGKKSIDAQIDFVGLIGVTQQNFVIAAVPEPSSIVLTVLGSVGLLLRRRR
jgi:hypothetical protein